MAVRKLDPAASDSRTGVMMRTDPTRIDPRKLKLGKGVARHDPRTLLLASYITPALPVPPVSFDLSPKVGASWGMMDNDQIGDCTCAAAGHLIMEWTANAGKKMAMPTDQQIVDAYSAITGYNPVIGANDNGAQEIDVLNYWRQTGIVGHKIGAYVALEPANHNHILDSVYVFEAAISECNCPSALKPRCRIINPGRCRQEARRAMASPGPGEDTRSRPSLMTPAESRWSLGERCRS